MDYYWYDFAGNVGVVLIIGTYLALQLGRMQSADRRFSLLNLVGAGLILLSLAFEFNLSAFIVEVFWAAISLIGLFRPRQNAPADAT